MTTFSAMQSQISKRKSIKCAKKKSYSTQKGINARNNKLFGVKICESLCSSCPVFNRLCQSSSDKTKNTVMNLEKYYYTT